MNTNSISGMYKCTICGNVTSHIQGKETLPCSHCNKNSWDIINKDADYLRSACEYHEQTALR
jgi:hypothetical protein